MILGKWVLDGSMALAWALPDEHSSSADAFWPAVQKDYLVWVPALFWYEIANGIAMAQKRGRILEAHTIRLIELFEKLPVRTDAMVGGTQLSRCTALAARHGLSAYDAAYLELACRQGFGLATLDDKLSRAAAKAGVEVWQPAS